MKLKKIEDLVEKTKSGEIDPERLSIILDNDGVSFYYGNEEADPDFTSIEIEEAAGYSDILPLYKLLFPGAAVNWC